MISADMRYYNFFLYDSFDRYGDVVLSEEVKGQVKIAIYLRNESNSTSALYSTAQYIGLTTDKDISDKYVIQYGNENLKVLYVNRQSRISQVFLERV